MSKALNFTPSGIHNVEEWQKNAINLDINKHSLTSCCNNNLFLLKSFEGRDLTFPRDLEVAILHKFSIENIKAVFYV